MKKDKLLSCLHNIDELLGIPVDSRTERQHKALLKLQQMVGQSRLARDSLPLWWQSLEKDPGMRSKILACCAMVPAAVQAHVRRTIN